MPMISAARFRLLPRLLLSAVLCLALSGAAAWAGTYAYQSTAFAWETAANNVVWDQTYTDYPRDDDKTVVNIGFTFTFGGVAYTQVRIHSNGALQFGADAQFHRQYANTNLPITTTPPGCSGCPAGSPADRVMLVYWDDINPRLGGTVRYETKGTAPNRRFVVSWENVPHYNYGGSYYFQVILYENGEFVYQYGAGNASGASATIGVEVDDSDYTLYSYNSSYSYNGTSIRWFVPSGAPPVAAEYWFEEAAWNGTANEVLDGSGNGRHGRAVGTAQPTAAGGGRVCRGASIPNNTSTGTIDAVDTGIDVDGQIGNSGSITFWYRNSVAWNVRDQQLLDATTVNNRWFFLTKRANGQLRFVLTDSAGATVAAQAGANATGADVWRHVAVTWRFAAGSNQTVLRIYVDGVQVAVTQATTSGALHSSVDTLFIGDNRSGVTGQQGTGNSAAGVIDEVRIYNLEISSAQVVADMNASHSCTLLNHIRLLHDGQALTCAPETVTVQACLDAGCTALYTGSVTTTLQPAGWVGGDTITFSGGSTTAQLRRTSTGTVTLGATGTTPAPVVAARCFNGATETCSLEFFDSGFIFDVPNLTACKPSAPVTIAAVRMDNITQTCAAAFTGTKTVNFWSTYSDPNTGTQQVRVNGTPIATASPGTDITLTFDAAAQASFTVSYPDAGQVQLNVRHTGSGGEAGLVLNGSDSFVSVPAGLAVYSTDANAACTSGDATCSVFTSAGSSFPLLVKAACWTSDSDTDLSDNPATTNFRMTGVPLSHSLVAPSSGQLGSLGVTSFDMTAADNGVHTVNQSVSEVGVFRFSATPAAGAYFGATVPGGTSANIGRFTPHHFALASGALANRIDFSGCGDGFTYMGEPFRLTYQLRAENLANGLTQNYTDSFAKLNLTSASDMSYGAASGATNLTARLAAGTASGIWTNGLGAVSADYSIARAAGPDGPYAGVAVGIAPRDSDGVQMPSGALNMDVNGDAVHDHARIGSTEVRFGRLRFANAYGSELLALPLALRVQHWNGTGFVDNIADTCTRLSAGSISVTFPAAPANQLAACETRLVMPALAVGTPFNQNALSLTAPGAGDHGWVDLRANLGAAAGNTCTGAAPTPATGANMAYLQGNWGGAPAYTVDPTARARFGAYKSNDRFIHFRENLW